MITRYKKALYILFILLAVIMFSSATKSSYYAKSVTVVKIYPHSMGYRVIYLTNKAETKEVYLPHSLFALQEDPTQERSRLFEGNDESYPYMTVFWKDGVFSHVKLYVKPSYSDITWGAFSVPEDYNDQFENNTLNFEF